ncbi:MAG TPA: N-acyl homoserine lactonase family protein [Thermoleophilaceae bacterium]
MSAPAVEVTVLPSGELRMPNAYAYRLHLDPGVMRAPCLAFALRHPEAGTILVDTGLHPDAHRSLRDDFGLPMSLTFATLRPTAEPFDAQLRGIGIEPEEVERVVMTHLHVDHTSGMRLLPNARFACARDEWRAATGRGAGAKGFVAHHLPPEERMELVAFEEDGEPHGPFARAIDLLGDGSIRLLSTPGHTPGHMSVLVRAADGAQVLLVGDAAYTMRNVEEQLLPLVTADDSAYARSLRELKAFAEAEPDATLVPSHDPDAWHDLAR